MPSYQVDLDDLIKAWGELWVKEQNEQARFKSIYFGGEKNKPEPTDRRKQQITAINIPESAWPPKLIFEPFSEALFTTSSRSPVVTKPEILFVYDKLDQLPDFRKIEGTENTFSFSKTVTKSVEVTTEVSFTSSIELSPIPIPLLLELNVSIELSLTRNKTVHQEESTEFSQEISNPAVGSVISFEATKSVVTKEQWIQPGGYVLVESSCKILPVERYRGTYGTPHKKWVVPAKFVFQDLLRYRSEKRLSQAQVKSLDALQMAEQADQVTCRLRYECGKVDNFRLKTYLKPALLKQFISQIEKWKNDLKEFNAKAQMISRLFKNTAPALLQDYYVDLTMRPIDDYRRWTHELKQHDRERMTQPAEVYAVIEQITEFQRSSSASIEQLLPAISQDASFPRTWQALVTGTAGVGKTTLAKKLTSLATGTFDWVFFISIRNLTQERYKEREVAYTIVDILTKECFPDERFPGIDCLIEATNSLGSLWQIYLKAVVTGRYDADDYQKMFCSQTDTSQSTVVSHPRALVILDGYDERCLPAHLQPVFQQLMSCPYLILTSRPYNLDGLSENYRFSPGQHAEITGFNLDNRNKFIKDFFSLARFLKSDGTVMADQFISYLQQWPYIANICQIPVNCEMACTAWMDGTLDPLVETVSALYSAVLISLSYRYLTKYDEQQLSTDAKDLDKRQALSYCRVHILFAEYFAFSGLVHHRLFYSTENARTYAEELGIQDAQLLAKQKNFGFIRPMSEGAEGLGEFYFSHLTFRDFFAARYLASCLQKQTQSSAQKVCQHDLHHFQLPSDCSTELLDQVSQVDDFLRMKRFDEEFELIFWFIAGLLNQAQDKTTLEYFLNLIVGEPQDTLGYYPALLLIRCLNEAQGLVEFCPNKERFYHPIKRWLKQSLSSQQLNFSDRISPLWERLKLSYRLLQLPFIEETVCEVISSSSSMEDLDRAVAFLEVIKLCPDKIFFVIKARASEISTSISLERLLESRTFCLMGRVFCLQNLAARDSDQTLLKPRLMKAISDNPQVIATEAIKSGYIYAKSFYKSLLLWLDFMISIYQKPNLDRTSWIAGLSVFYEVFTSLEVFRYSQGNFLGKRVMPVQEKYFTKGQLILELFMEAANSSEPYPYDRSESMIALGRIISAFYFFMRRWPALPGPLPELMAFMNKLNEANSLLKNTVTAVPPVQIDIRVAALKALKADFLLLRSEISFVEIQKKPEEIRALIMSLINDESPSIRSIVFESFDFLMKRDLISVLEILGSALQSSDRQITLAAIQDLWVLLNRRGQPLGLTIRRFMLPPLPVSFLSEFVSYVETLSKWHAAPTIDERKGHPSWDSYIKEGLTSTANALFGLIGFKFGSLITHPIIALDDSIDRAIISVLPLILRELLRQDEENYCKSLYGILISACQQDGYIRREAVISLIKLGREEKLDALLTEQQNYKSTLLWCSRHEESDQTLRLEALRGLVLAYRFLSMEEVLKEFPLTDPTTQYVAVAILIVRSLELGKPLRLTKTEMTYYENKKEVTYRLDPAEVGDLPQTFDEIFKLMFQADRSEFSIPIQCAESVPEDEVAKLKRENADLQEKLAAAQLQRSAGFFNRSFSETVCNRRFILIASLVVVLLAFAYEQYGDYKKRESLSYT